MRVCKRMQRGVTMILALIIVAILLAVALTVLAHANITAAAQYSVDGKSDAFNAAEAGVSEAIQTVDSNPDVSDVGCLAVQSLPGTNATFVSCVQSNNVNNPAPTPAPDPRPGGTTVNVPAGTVLVYGHGSAPGGRDSWVEAIVTKGKDFVEPRGPLAATNCIVDSYNPKSVIDLGGLPNRMVGNNCILINGTPASPNGGTGAGVTNQLVGLDGKPTGPQFVATFPSVAQVNQRQADALAVAQSAPSPWNNYPVASLSGTVNVPGNAFIDACPDTPALTACPSGTGVISLSSGTINLKNGGTIYIHGSISFSGSATMVNQGGSLVVVTNSYASSGNSGYQLGGGSTAVGELLVLGTDSATTACTGTPTASISGNGSNTGHVYVPFGNAMLAGNGAVNGSVNSGVAGSSTSNIYLCGGGVSGGFVYNPNDAGPQNSPFFHIAAYMEY